ncbi:MAG: hypothetical protein ACRD82_17065, partial [Blastocatellia bacterium]
FEIHDAEAYGLELKAFRSASISGRVLIEGATDPAVLKRVADIRLEASASFQQIPQTPFFPSSQMTGSDGSFRLAGLRAGTHRISVNDVGSGVPLRLVRIERSGANVSDTIELAAGEQITGLKIMMAPGLGIIRGQITAVNGSLRPDLQLLVFTAPANGGARMAAKPAQVDARGKFVVEGLVPGEYELKLMTVIRSGMPAASLPVPVQQKVTVGVGETPVTLTIDFGEK